MKRTIVFTTIAVLIFGARLHADDSSLPGSALALHSSGEAAGEDWTFKTNGYAGTFIKLASDGTARIELSASATGGGDRRGAVVVEDQIAGFTIGDAPATIRHEFPLSAGVHCARVEFTSAAEHADQTLTIHHVGISGAQVLNDATDDNALAASQSFIDHGRKVPVTLSVPDFAPGESVHVKLARKAFNFGANVPSASNKYLVDNPPPDSDAAKFQGFIIDHFNMVVPSNGGKWSLTEPSPGQLTMDYADTIMRFAKAHGIRGRMHNLIWDTEQQPPWVRKLIDAADAGDADAKAKLRKAISSRIDYYVKDRAANFIELDVLNESLHRFGYWKAFGADGIADIYNETARAVKSAGGSTRLYLNEYNVLQWSQAFPFKKDSPSDPYANWYRAHAEELIRAGGALSGVGVQYYCSYAPPAVAKSPHSPIRIFEALQNLSTLHLPITLTEFAVSAEATDAQAVKTYDDTLRLIYGNPQATSFLLWGFWAGAVSAHDLKTALVDKDWHLTPAGHEFEQQMAHWSTDLTALVQADHTVHFEGFAGDYEIAAGAKAIHSTFPQP